MKSVIVSVRIPSAFFVKAGRVTKRLGIDPQSAVGEVMKAMCLQQLEEDPELWLSCHTFPDRQAAQRAVTEYYRKNSWVRAHEQRHQVQFMHKGRERWEWFDAPGTKRALRKLNHLWAVANKGGKAGDRAYKAIEKLVGCPVARTAAA